MGQDQDKTNTPTAKTLKDQISPVSSFKANKYEIRALPKGFGEWSLYGMISNSKAVPGEPDYVLMPSGVPRQPWEAFQEVGFRSVQTIGKNR